MKKPSIRRGKHTASDSNAPDFEVAIIGAGPGGIAAGVKLKAAGVQDFVIIDRDTDFGGSWHENHYPGLSVDIPWPAYQFAFARKSNWSRFFPLGPEVKQYHVDVARRHGLYPHARFGTDIVKEEFDDATHQWRLHTATGEIITARFLISAVGAFVRPKENAIAGIADFDGKIQRPSSWDDDWDHTGKRVAVIGTGASAIQIIPAIADQVAAMDVYQRTPVWSFPKPDFATPRALELVFGMPGVLALLHGGIVTVIDLALRGVVAVPPAAGKPMLRAFDRVTIAAYRRYVGMRVEDPVTAAKLSPDFGPIVKRPTMNNKYLTTFNRPEVELITDPIDRITGAGIRTRDGSERGYDMIVVATGYEVFSDPETYRPGTIVGRNGFDLGKFYSEEGLQAYESVSVPGLPNRWTLVGPFSWTGTGWHDMVDMTADHAVRAISAARRRGATLVEIRKDIADAYHRKIHQNNEIVRYYLAGIEKNAKTPTYYRNSQGESTYIRPTGFFEARRGNRKFPLEHYRFEAARLNAVPDAPPVLDAVAGA